MIYTNSDELARDLAIARTDVIAHQNSSTGSHDRPADHRRFTVSIGPEAGNDLFAILANRRTTRHDHRLPNRVPHTGSTLHLIESPPTPSSTALAHHARRIELGGIDMPRPCRPNTNIRTILGITPCTIDSGPAPVTTEPATVPTHRESGTNLRRPPVPTEACIT